MWNLLNFMKSCEILWISVQIWWTPGGFHIMQISMWITLWISLWILWISYEHNLIPYVRPRKWRISLESVFPTDFRWISHWNLPNFMKSAGFHTKIYQFYEIHRISCQVRRRGHRRPLARDGNPMFLPFWRHCIAYTKAKDLSHR